MNKKKVGVLTLYKSNNHGAYWQARSLYEFIEKLGYEPVFLDWYTLLDDLSLFKAVLKPRSKKVAEAWFNLEKFNQFRLAANQFQSFSLASHEDCDKIHIDSCPWATC